MSAADQLRRRRLLEVLEHRGARVHEAGDLWLASPSSVVHPLGDEQALAVWGLHPSDGPWDVVAGTVAPLKSSRWERWVVDQVGGALSDAVVEYTGAAVLQHQRWPWALCRLSGLVAEGDELVLLEVGFADVGPPEALDLTPAQAFRLAWRLEVSGLQRAIVALMVPRPGDWPELALLRVSLEDLEGLGAPSIAETVLWRRRHLVEGAPLPVDGTLRCAEVMSAAARASTGNHRRLEGDEDQVLERLAAARRAELAATEERRRLEQELVRIADGARYLRGRRWKVLIRTEAGRLEWNEDALDALEEDFGPEAVRHARRLVTRRDPVSRAELYPGGWDV